VGVDFATAARIAADHLFDLGHRRIGVVAMHAYDEPRIRIREASFRDRLAERGAPIDPTLWRKAHDTLQTGYEAGQSLLSLDEPPSAVFAANDLLAIGVMAAARELRICVPRDLSVVGFDDIAMSRFLTPPLTTVHIEKTELMAHATELLFRLIAGDEAVPAVSIVPTLAVRESTAPPSGDAGARCLKGGD
jgi:LacI family transcriptional regulator